MNAVQQAMAPEPALLLLGHSTGDHPTQRDAVADEFAAALVDMSSEPRIPLDGHGIDGDQGRDAVSLQEVEKSEHPDPVPVLTVGVLDVVGERQRAEAAR